MSRTTLCAVTAGGLAALSIGLMVWRYYELGEETKAPLGPGTWKVTLIVRGKTHGGARLITAAPLDFNRQHIFNEAFRSAEMKERQEARHPDCCRHPERRVVLWSQRPGGGKGIFQVRYEFYCAVKWHKPSSPMAKLTRTLYAPPRLGEHIASEPRLDPSAREISTLALRLVAGLNRPADQARELFRYVDKEIGNEPSVNGPGISDVECLKNCSGDASAKSRLLVSLCRNRGIPARLVTGVALSKDQKESAHVWVEAWVNGHWMPMCPYYHHLGKVPPTYLVFGFGDMLMARGQNLHDLDYGFRVEHLSPRDGAAEEEEEGFLRGLMLAYSFHNLPPTARRLVEFLLLLPIAALIICVYRNLIGLESFGTFAPALIGLAFRDLRDSWRGILVFVAIVLIGWGMRRILDRYHLLQVPRKAFVLSLVVLLLLTSIVAANHHGLEATTYITLFPMVILTGMIERFWTLEVEDGTSSSFKTLLTTMLIAGSISLLLGLEVVVDHMFRYPETLGLIMACQLLIGRYTGYRLSELYRFRDFVKAV
jgi:hypothetical protein